MSSRSPLLLLLVPLLLGAGVADGTVVDRVTLFSSSDPALCYDIVILGDGFKDNEQVKFNGLVDSAVEVFLNTNPFNGMSCAFNIHRINVASTDSGIDVPSSCVETPWPLVPSERATAMDTTWCGDANVFRCVKSADEAAVHYFANEAPDADVILVLVNDYRHGGCASGNIAYSTIESNFEETVVHELGHAMGQLADEYAYGKDDHFNDQQGEPSRVNVTKNDDRATIKWHDLVLESTEIPTKRRSECSDRYEQSDNNVRDIVGAFEGAQYNGCGIYRPSFACTMRESNAPFCAVCRGHLIRKLRGFLAYSQSVFLDDILVRNAHDQPWLMPNEIYFSYRFDGPRSVSGVWPWSGTVEFQEGWSKPLNYLVDVIPDTTSGTLHAKVREKDPLWENTLIRDSSVGVSVASSFMINEDDYRIRGRSELANLRILLDSIHIKDDHDWWKSGDIAISYSVSNGAHSIDGRWPASGTIGIESGSTQAIGTMAAAILAPEPIEAPLIVSIRVVDADAFNTDDLIGNDIFEFSIVDYTNMKMIHIRDKPNYRLTLSIVSN